MGVVACFVNTAKAGNKKVILACLDKDPAVATAKVRVSLPPYFRGGGATMGLFDAFFGVDLPVLYVSRGLAGRLRQAE